MENSGRTRYYVLFTQTLKQWDVTESIRKTLPEGRGVVFYPCVELWMGSLGQTVVEPLFPGYVFIRSDMDQYEMHDFIRERRREVLSFLKELRISERQTAGEAAVVEGEESLADLNEEEAELLDFMLGFRAEAGQFSEEEAEVELRQAETAKAGEGSLDGGMEAAKAGEEAVKVGAGILEGGRKVTKAGEGTLEGGKKVAKVREEALEGGVEAAKVGAVEGGAEAAKVGAVEGGREATKGSVNQGKRIWSRKLPASGVLEMSYGYKDKNGRYVVMEGPLKGHEDRIVDVNPRDRRAYLNLKVGGRLARAGLTLLGKKYWFPTDKASPDVLGDGTVVNCREVAAAMMGKRIDF